MRAAKQSLINQLWRGLTRRCPRCGIGELYEGWSKVRERCSNCGVRYVRNQGDPWFFLLVLDRAVLLFPIVAALFFGLHRAHIVLFVAVCVLATLGFALTTPNRYGICLALDYLTRVRWGDLREESNKSAVPPRHETV